MLFFVVKLPLIDTPNMAEKYPEEMGSTHNEEEGAGYTLRLLSQNMWGVYTGNYGPHFQDRLSRLAKAAKDYDVLVIQEFPLFKLLGITLGAAAMEKFYTEISPWMPFSSINSTSNSLPYILGGNSGLIIFSRYPIISEKETTFKNYPWFEASYKGFQHVRIKIQRRRPILLHVINTHLYSHGKAWVRPAQLQEIAEYKNGLIKNEMIFISGDFNICPRTHPNCVTEFQALCDAMQPLEIKSNPDEVTYPSEGATYDHCFAGGDQILDVAVSPVELFYTDKVGNELPISDHKGLSVRIRMEISP